MKNNIRKKILLILLLLSVQSVSNAQVLISLLLGDKLNSDKLEFGLAGGLNWSNMTELETSHLMMDWHLGFYFDFKMNEKLFINTGVIVKSKLGSGDLDAYPLTPNLDSVFLSGKVDRKINYFNVPGTVRYRFVDYFQAEAGIMLGLRYTAFDLFKNTVEDEDDLSYKYANNDNYTRLDAGLIGGLSYKLSKGKGMNIFGRYYYGLVDVDKTIEKSQKNTSIYAGVEIPIGRGKAEKKKAEKEKTQDK